MTRMILAKGIGAALALAVVAGFVGQASAGLREYCDSYARDVANRKTNSGADGQGKGVMAGGAVLGAGVTGDRFKRVYTNAYERCVANYEGTREPEKTAEGETPDQKAVVKKPAASEATDKKAAASGDVTDDNAAASEVTDKKAAASQAPVKKVAASEKKVAAGEAVEKKVAANEATPKKVAANDATDKDKACARKYRSFDPQTGKYKSMSGKWRPCRL